MGAGSISMPGVTIPVGDSPIVVPLTPDGRFGYDKFGQMLLASKPDAGGWTSYRSAWDVRTLTCGICRHGWENNADSLGDQVRWRLTDELVHLSCAVRHQGFIERAEITNAVVGNMRFAHIEPIPNQYYGEEPYKTMRPWYIFVSIDHPVTLEIGHRKRVYSIEVRPTLQMPPMSKEKIENLFKEEQRRSGKTPFPFAKELAFYEAAREEFKDEDVTKEFSKKSVLIHAWTSEKLRDYVERLAKVGGFGIAKDPTL